LRPKAAAKNKTTAAIAKANVTLIALNCRALFCNDFT